MKFEPLLCLALLCAGCGGTSLGDLFDQDAAASSDASSDAAKSDAAPTSDGGPYACGATSCASGEFCIHPCCGGARPPCVEIDDAGACPPGTTNDPPGCSGSGDTFVCGPDPCVPDPPYCSPTATCGEEFAEPDPDHRNVACACE